uniref:Uncharacterized protein n=1 Tax=Caenorhabditis tropicalis TaxID=1561998 RepID=A0A1I7TVH2_9PELO
MTDITDEYRKGRPTLLVPLNGIQLFEITNHDSNVRKIYVSLFSARFALLESIRTSEHYYHFDSVLQPNGSIVFAIKDNGHVEEPNYEISLQFEGSFHYSISKDPYVEAGKEPELYNLPDLAVNTNPETDSYRKLCAQRDYHADCLFEDYKPDPMEKIIKLEPITKEKYGEKVSEKVYPISDIQRKANIYISVDIIIDKKNGEVIGMQRVHRVKRDKMKRSEQKARLEKNMKADKSLMELLGYKKTPTEDPTGESEVQSKKKSLDTSKSKVESKKDADPPKATPEELEVQSKRSESRISVAEPKKSVKSEVLSKSETKSIQKTSKSEKTEKSKHSEYIKGPDEDVVIQKTLQEEEGKKKKKKTKRCVIC